MKTLEMQYHRLSENRKNMLQFFLFTIVSFLVILFGYSVFYRAGRTWVWTQDGVGEYVPKTIYIAKWLRSIFTEFRMYDFSLDMGADAITYNSIWFFEPLNLLLLLSPERHYNALFTVTMALRFYLTGVSAYVLFRYLDKNTNLCLSRTAQTVGALTYEFCGFTLLKYLKHPNFCMPMIVMPLLVLTLDRLIAKKKWLGFVLTVCVAVMTSIYFFYMCVILTVLYYFIRYADLIRERKWKQLIAQTLQVFGYALLGIALSSVLMLPNLFAILNSSRLGGIHLTTSHFWTYGKNRLKNTLMMFLVPIQNAGFDTFLGFIALAYYSVVVLYMKRRSRILRSSLFLIFILYLLPIWGYVMGAFGNVSSRWVFGIALLIAATVAVTFQDFLALSDLDLRILGCAAIPYLYMVYTDPSYQTRRFFFSALSLILTYAALWFIHRYLAEARFTANLILAVLVCGNLFLYFSYFSAGTSGLLKEYLEQGRVVSTAMDDPIYQVREEIEDDDFYRISKNNTNPISASMLSGYYGTVGYDDIPSSALNDFYGKLGVIRSMICLQPGLNDRTVLDTLSCVRYHVLENEEDEKLLPYGYSLYKKVSRGEKEFYVYQNDQALPLGYTYDSYVKEASLDESDELERQEIMEDTVILNSNDLPDTKVPQTASFKIDPAEVSYTNCRLSEGKLKVRKKNAAVEFRFDAIPDSEYYVYISGINVTPVDPFIVSTISASSDVRTSRTQIRSDGYPRTTRQRNFLLNLGYSEEGLTSCKVTFEKKGTYDLDQILVLCQPMRGYTDAMESLRKESLEDIVTGTNTVTGNITVSTDKILCLSIPYSKGWTAKVDGDKAKLYRANYNSMALMLDKGTHTIELDYCTPGLKAGIVLSAVSLIIILFLSRKDRRGKKRNSGCC